MYMQVAPDIHSPIMKEEMLLIIKLISAHVHESDTESIS